MIFSNMLFCLAFLPVMLLCYYACRTVKSRNIVLLAFSLIFYAFGEPVYIAVMVLMSLFSWLFSRLIDTSKNEQEKKLWMTAAITICIGSIIYFRYLGATVEAVNSAIGIQLISAPQVHLPIGISFYTLRLISYITDVYKGKAPSQKNFRNVLLYAALFHNTIAAPIVSYSDIENQLTKRTSGIREITNGITKYACGFSKKAILANSCAAVANSLLFTGTAAENRIDLTSDVSLFENIPAASLWAGTAFFMLQIYLEFSAYSDIAIGTGLMFGFRYKENFSYPYTASSLTGFCKSWNIYLGEFFKNYIYIPIGGSRNGKIRLTISIFAACMLTALWYGASLNFVLTGFFLFILLLFEKLFYGKFVEKHKIIGRIYLLITVFFGCVLVRFSELDILISVLKGMLCLNGNPAVTNETALSLTKYIFLFIICALSCTPIIKYVKRQLIKAGKTSDAANIIYRCLDIAAPAILLLISSISLLGDSYNQFMNFRF